MKIKDAIRETCPTCGVYVKTIEKEQFGCDFCKKYIDLQDNKYHNKTSPHLDATIFFKHKMGQDIKTTHLQFCSWKCLYSKLKEFEKKKNINFIALPYLSFDRDIKDKYCGDFFECIK